MKAARDIVAAYAQVFPPEERGAQALPPAPTGKGPRHALILPPHPDDECLMGLLALRLLRESGWRVSVLPMTYGSREDRRAARKAELATACAHMGFRLADTPPDGIGNAAALAGALRTERPELILAPHALDWHPTHERVHRLLLAALDAMKAEAEGMLIAETEYWQPMREPNLLLAAEADDVARLTGALMQHEGEIARNPYHLSFPALMIDSVRRGAERVGGKGAQAPTFTFGQLYRLNRWQKGQLTPLTSKIVSAQEQVEALLSA